MNWRLPNQLTVGRLLLAGVFFVLLALYDAPAAEHGWLLDVSLVVYLLAGLTDVLDGYLARKWNVVSAFGRITDPFVDKVLVCGAFALLTGSNFVFGDSAGDFERSLPFWLIGHMASGVQAWMVVVVMAREFIVSGVRGYSESQGQTFPATVYGKVKLFTQSLAICAVLLQLGNFPRTDWAVIVRLALVWVSVLATVLSGLAYVNRARRLLASD